MFSEVYFVCTTSAVHPGKTPLPRRRLGPIRLGRPALRACVSGVVVLENIGPDRVVLHDRKSGIGCSSSTTLFVIAAGALSETGKCILSTVGLVESNAMTAGPTESNAMAVGAAESNPSA